MGILRSMPPITLTIERERIALVRRLLLKIRAEELSDLRRIETQLSVYGDRRANMETEPAAITARIEMLSDLLAEIEAQATDGD
jgi:hypothetical protein